MRARIDPTRCRGFGLCVELRPREFDADDFGLSQAVGEEIAPSEEAAVQRAMDKCPYEAIRWVADDSRAPRLLRTGPSDRSGPAPLPDPSPLGGNP